MIIKVGSHYAINGDIWPYLLGDNFLAQVWTFLSSNIDKLSLNIVKYRSTQISKFFDKYRQMSSRFRTYSIEFQMLSKDAVSEIKLRCFFACNSMPRSGCSALQGWIPIKKKMKNARRNLKIRCVWKMHREKLSRNWNL